MQIQNLPPLPLSQSQNEKQVSPATQAAGTFQDMLGNLVSDVSNQEQQADHAIQKLHTGEEKNLHEAMILMEQADISLRYLVQVRNKALDAYQTIMQMQV
ncbi:flagellar hook-basal body complex protein FliE [Desulfogranum japonicum]|uniref:flagellar hook-basal body complex protein FliE n=1 Tax=Desulfogranum japonicum TaxID=231447 RepID=UPI000414612F|nr:flagellar hook-basal body complex protein FliE [Desulfogranum japonicum]